MVVDPRRVGLANKADLVLQVRPGTDGALALAFVDVLIREGLFDEPFVREWTNAPLLVRDDTGRLLGAADVCSERLADGRPRRRRDAVPGARARRPAGWSRTMPRLGATARPADALALRGSTEVHLADGRSSPAGPSSTCWPRLPRPVWPRGRRRDHRRPGRARSSRRSV